MLNSFQHLFFILLQRENDRFFAMYVLQNVFTKGLLFMKIFLKKISDYLSAILHRPKTIKKLLKLRYFLFSFRKPLKIVFLRLYNEEYTVIPCLMSVIDMVDIIVLIYSDIDDSSLELVKRYIKENKLEKNSLSGTTLTRYSPNMLPNAN